MRGKCKKGKGNQVKRVAVLLHGLCACNGIEVLFARLSRFIDPEKAELTFLLAVDPGTGQQLEKEITDRGIRVIHLHDTDHGRIFRWPLTVCRALKRYGPFDAVHANMDFINGIILFAARLAGVPMRICHAHAPGSNREQRSLKRKAYYAVMRWLIRHNATIRLACAENAGEFFYAGDRFQVLMNGIEPDRFLRPDPKHGSGQPEPREDGDYRFVAAGRFTPEKNPLFLLDVFEAVHRQLPAARLTWAGDGRMLQEVQQKACEKGLQDAVIFTGGRNDIENILTEGDCFLFPSVYEAFGMALLEAQAAGLDCFVSDAVPRTVDCGKCIYIPLKEGADAWADRIIRYLSSGERMELDEGKLRKLDIRNTAEKLTAMYQTGAFPPDTLL